MKHLIVLLWLVLGVWPSLWAQPILTFEEYASGFTFPVDIAHAGDERLFVVERSGIIRIIDGNGVILPTPFLNIEERVEHFNAASGEIGLLGLAFHPDYANNGFFYLNYIDTDFNTAISRFQVSADDPNVAEADSETILMNITQPFLNHNGGCMKFGPDGYLYISSGDGGSAGDPMGFAQNRLSLLGKILRIDVDNGNPYSIPTDNPFADDDFTLDEIWAIGLRNPWRFSFDRQTGDLWIGDVGQGLYEEVNYEAAGSSGGLNYGWRCLEGNEVFNDSGCEDPSNFAAPIEAYPHTGHCSITGGFVYRGSNFSSLQGHYIYGDYCSGQFWTIVKNGNGEFVVNEAGIFQSFAASSLGEDQNGELYLAHLTEGTLFKIGVDACSEFTLSAQITNENCTGTADGAIDLILSNGVAPFSYTWSNGANTEDIGPLEAGIYTVTVSDDDGCIKTEAFTVGDNEAGLFSVEAEGPVDFCDGGSVTLRASAISDNYTYQWYNGGDLLAGATTDSLIVTASGAYYIRLEGPC
ncbi:MAG: PQQ-dependent sugar dehydrogenase, partial [Bacteroidota bacterium]